MVGEQSPLSFGPPWAIHSEGCARNLNRKKGGGKIEKMVRKSSNERAPLPIGRMWPRAQVIWGRTGHSPSRDVAIGS